MIGEMEPATWKEFHKKFIEQSSVLTAIGYGPFVPKPPTNPDVVHGVSGLLLHCRRNSLKIQECHFEDGRFPYAHEFFGGHWSSNEWDRPGAADD